MSFYLKYREISKLWQQPNVLTDWQNVGMKVDSSVYVKLPIIRVVLFAKSVSLTTNYVFKYQNCGSRINLRKQHYQHVEKAIVKDRKHKHLQNRRTMIPGESVSTNDVFDLDTTNQNTVITI
jgi:hypothetical protein